MDVGNRNHWAPGQVVPSAELLRSIRRTLAACSRGRPGGTAARSPSATPTTTARGEIGFISSVTAPSAATAAARGCRPKACSTRACSRPVGTDLRAPLRAGASDEELVALLRGAWLQRGDRYSETAGRAARGERAAAQDRDALHRRVTSDVRATSTRRTGPAMVDVERQGRHPAHGRRRGARAISGSRGAAYCAKQDFATAKGPVFHTAIVAGVMAAKRTHELIPFCHPLGIENCRVAIDMNDAGRGRHPLHGRRCITAPGVEMEALTGASIAALTIYDMCKALSHEIVIAETRLRRKARRQARRGRRGAWGTSDRLRLATAARTGAGGRRQPRMGTDKAALEFHGRTQLDWAYDLLARHCERVFVSVRATRRTSRHARPACRRSSIGTRHRTRSRESPRRRHALPDSAWLVVACDLPFARPTRALETAGRARDGRDRDRLPQHARRPARTAVRDLRARDARTAFVAAIAGGRYCPRKFVIATRRAAARAGRATRARQRQHSGRAGARACAAASARRRATDDERRQHPVLRGPARAGGTPPRSGSRRRAATPADLYDGAP